MPANAKPHIAVIGAGAFGGWTALSLVRRRARVTLIDAWGPANPRSSSAGDTRVIRGTYGPDEIYTQMVAHALELWKECNVRWGRTIYHRTGAMWLASGGDDSFEEASIGALERANLEYDKLGPDEASHRYPQINFEGVKWVIYEHDAGFLSARVACELVLKELVRNGVDFHIAHSKPGLIQDRVMTGVELSDGSTLTADQYVFACGPWLGTLFPDVLGHLIKPTRQEVFFFGPPAGDDRFGHENMPVWLDHSAEVVYGIPGDESTGFKISDHRQGPAFDPTSGDRVPSAEGLAAIRKYVAFRFPALADAPMVSAQVCQYENTPDQHFIIDRHPLADNVTIVGGGSGHGFKHAPAVAEMACNLALKDVRPDKHFLFSRFA
jgi:glycine/D-amino acid oxidase-like deaminating enzyme